MGGHYGERRRGGQERLAGSLAVAWRKDGPPPEKAFWAILSYFIEIAVVGLFEVSVNISRAARPSRGHEWEKEKRSEDEEPEEKERGEET